MLQSQKYNIEKINEIGKSEIIKILTELSEKAAISRKRIVPQTKSILAIRNSKKK